MRGSRAVVGARLLSAALSAALLISAASCSYLQWRRTKNQLRSALQKNPGNLILEKEYAPEGCFGLSGRIEVPANAPLPVLAAAFDRSSAGREMVGSREVMGAMGHYGVLLPAGTYDLVFFADLNHNGWYETNEVVGRTPPDSPVVVGAGTSVDGMIVPAPAVVIDVDHPGSVDVAVHIEVEPRPFVVESVDDPLFSPEMGELGVYWPNRFLARTQSWFFSVGEPDFSKPQLVLVHGIGGTPRDFQTLIAGVGRSRYQVWLFYFPSGLRLEQLGIVLAHGVERIVTEGGTPDARVALVAHSMGGLVGRRAVNELSRSGRPPYLRVYASFNTPYGGVDAAARAVQKGSTIVPSWADIAVGSPFLTGLYETPIPKDLPFYLFFGWGQSGKNGPSPAGDGTIGLASQLDPRVKLAATRALGYGATHVGILSDADALDELARVLDAATTEPAPHAGGTLAP